MNITKLTKVAVGILISGLITVSSSFAMTRDDISDRIEQLNMQKQQVIISNSVSNEMALVRLEAEIIDLQTLYANADRNEEILMDELSELLQEKIDVIIADSNSMEPALVRLEREIEDKAEKISSLKRKALHTEKLTALSIIYNSTEEKSDEFETAVWTIKEEYTNELVDILYDAIDNKQDRILRDFISSMEYMTPQEFYLFRKVVGKVSVKINYLMINAEEKDFHDELLYTINQMNEIAGALAEA